MARGKYPGIQILYEVGTRKELAESYGVSERTMYRWLNKAKAETHERQQYPGAKRIANFKGTRKELAAKYNISERTAYRWLNKARSEGADVPSRQARSKYPGPVILEETGTNKSIGDRYGVSEATIRRWKRQATAETWSEDTGFEQPEATFEEPEATFEQPEADFEQPGEEHGEEFDEEQQREEDGRKLLYDLLNQKEQFVDNSIFFTYEPQKQLQLLQSYIDYQYELNPFNFYNKETHQFDFSPDFVSSINIWGDEFETYLNRLEDLTDFETDWMDDL